MTLEDAIEAAKLKDKRIREILDGFTPAKVADAPRNDTIHRINPYMNNLCPEIVLESV